jgi:heavy metal sensor kinase
LAWAYGGAVFVIVMLVSIVSLTAIDRSLRNALDARLTTAAAATTALADVHHGRLMLDRDDREHVLVALGDSMSAAVFTPDGRTYMTSANAVPPELARVAREHQGGSDAVSVGSGDRKLRVVFAPVERDGVTYGTVAVWQGSNYIDEFDKSAILAIAVAAFGIGGIVVLLSSTLARRALAPLERFTEVATEIEAQDLSRRVGSERNDELGRLGSAFNRMLDRIEAAFTRQRRFTADASHELRAPLAVIRAEADVALGRERSGDEYRQALQTIVQEVDRMDRLVDALLVAARADAANLHLEPIDAGAIVSLAAARFAPAASARGITLEIAAEDAYVNGDAQALERAVAALVHNALDFAQSRVSVRVGKDSEGVELTVEDDGAGFTPDGLAHATERFWRGDPARRRGGTGLGLSIVEAIVRAHGGGLTLSNATPHGARVTLSFPFIDPSFAAGTMEA